LEDYPLAGRIESAKIALEGFIKPHSKKVRAILTTRVAGLLPAVRASTNNIVIKKAPVKTGASH
jgi:hypothetical protein